MLLPAFFISKIVIFIVFTLSFPYICHTFWRLRYHFIISARFPVSTVCIAALCYLNMVLAIIADLVEYHNVHSIVLIFLRSIVGPIAYLICALITYRLLLVYDKWIQQNHVYGARSTIVKYNPDPVTVQTLRYSLNTEVNRYSCCNDKFFCFKQTARNTVKIVLLGQTLVYCICDFVGYSSLSKILWTVWLIVSAVLLFKARKIKESLSFKSETWCCVIALVIFMPLKIILNKFDFPNTRHWITFIGCVLS